MPTINAIGTPQITLGGTFTMSGAFTFIGRLTGNTDVTFPTSGTLATTSGSVPGIIGTANQVLANGTSGVAISGTNVTLTTPQDIATTSSPTFAALTLTSPLTVANGGSGLATLTAYTLLAGGTTATGVMQQVLAGSAGQLLQSNGASALPTWTTATFPSGSGTLNHMLRSDGTNWVETTATTLDATDVMSGITQLNVDNLRLDGNTLSSTDTNGNINLLPNGSGAILGGQSSTFWYNAGTIALQMTAISTAANFVAGSFANTVGNAPKFEAYKSRSTTPGAFVAVQANDELVRFRAWGDDGTQFSQAGGIVVLAEGTISSGIVPGRMQLFTTNASGVEVTALTLSSLQVATFASNVLVPAGIVTSGSAGGGVVGQFQAFSTTAALGSLSLTAANSAGNFANVLTNASTAAARTWTLPDASGTIALTGSSVASITGTANQVLANATSGVAQTGAVTLTTPQDIGTTSAVQFNSVRFNTANALLDANGNPMISFTSTASAVNGFSFTNGGTGVGVSFGAFGSDTNINLNVSAQGEGVVRLRSALTSNQFQFNTGAAFGQVTTLNIPSGTNIITFPSGTVTLATTASASGHVTSGTQNQMAWYAATGDTVSGLATANNGILSTNASGVPAINTTVDFVGQFNADNLTLDGNTLSSTSGVVNLQPLAGQFVTMTGTNAAFDVSLISTNATGFPALNFYRNTTTTIGRIQGGLNDAFNATGDGLFISNPVSGGKIFLRDSTGNALTISAGVTSLSNPLGAASGGTGYNNVGTWANNGNVEFAGAFTFTGTLTGNTSVTFPTSGTLATTATASGIVNSGTQNQLTWYAATGTTVSGLATANNGILVTSAGGVPSIGNTIGASISVTGTVTASTGFAAGANALNTFATSTSPTSNSFTITKSYASTTAQTVLQITVPASEYFIAFELFISTSRSPNADIGTSCLAKRYFSIARNGSGSNVVLDSAAGPDWTATTTTAGGAQNSTVVTTIVRNGAEANTAPQVVNITLDANVGANGCRAMIVSTISMLGSLTGFSIT